MDVDGYLEKVKKGQILPESDVKKLCRKVKEILFEQSNIQPVQCPVSVCGDVHGQFYDVQQLFLVGGGLQGSHNHNRYIMIGDFVDRGYNSVQTITLLFCFKVKWPDRMVLLRGNHESRRINLNYGFYQEVQQKYGNPKVWNLFNDAFDYLPIGAVIEGGVFCVHGGLSPQLSTVDQMRTLDRCTELPMFGPFADLMWSDPADDVENWALNERGAGWKFGREVVKRFTHKNSLNFVVRAHQLVQQGYQKHFDGTMYTIWSAPNYCYRMNNLAAIMRVNEKFDLKFDQFQASKLSKTSENYQKVIPYFL